MINSIEGYLAELKKEMSGADRATIQDALSDAEEYLRTALDSARDTGEISETDALPGIIERYGTPSEVAAAYRENETRTSRAYVPVAVKEAEVPEPVIPAAPDTRSFLTKFFGIFTEQRAWGALLYLVFALGTGIIYFTWVVTGASTSAGLLILIVGIPIAMLFLLSVRGIALLEGRIVEALLGVRMPRRPLFSRKDLSFWGKLKGMLTQRHTWTSMVYMILQLPLGIIYFTVIVTLVALSVSFIGRPLFELVFDIPVMGGWDNGYLHTYTWAMPFVVIGGVLLLTATMHVVKYMGKFHGAWSKIMLVNE
ncbi:MAG: sensor domain-containing protein [Dehalococcoidales bacterium]|nr:sensor domain-containing protein [Dehalococcoidales bacterium]